MLKMPLKNYVIFLSFCVFFLCNKASAQYITNGNASIIDCHCYSLTTRVNFQSGSVWNSNKIDLTNSFDFSFDVFFGCNDANGADGIVFMLQPISTSIGSTGGGLGFQGIVPSVGVLMDTYQNTPDNDPVYDHISINKNGDNGHGTSNNLAGPIRIIDANDNAEDCAWHVVKIVWDASTKLYSAYVDGVLRVQTTIDMVATVFGGNPLVYWGFSASTGGLNNDQKFCTRLNSTINSNINNNASCLGTPVNFVGAVDAFIPITNYYWDFGDGTTSTLQNPPPHNYATAGLYKVKFTIKAADGCTSDTAVQNITIGAIPVPSFQVNDTCQTNPINLVSTSTINFGSIIDYYWVVDGNVLTNASTISNSSYAVGTHTVKHYVKSNVGCFSDTAFGSFQVFPKPTASFVVNDTCEGKPTIIKSIATNPSVQYSWIIDGVLVSNVANITNVYAVGSHTIKHFVKNTNGCTSDTAYGTFIVYAIPVANILVRDTCIGNPITFTTTASGSGITYKWLVDGFLAATTQSFTNNSYTAGNHLVQLIVTNQGFCSDIANGSFNVFNKPLLSGISVDACVDFPSTFTATLLNPPFANINYHWKFNDGATLIGASVQKTFNAAGQGIVQLYANNAIGCNSDTIQVNYTVVAAKANAGNDSIVTKNQTFLLNGSGNANNISWSPSSFLSNASIYNPSLKLTASQLFTLTITTPEGCIDTDDVLINVYDTTAIYIPTAFTPNGDTKNDVLLPFYIGIASVEYFNIYNRYGQLIFTTNKMTIGWDGKVKNQPQPIGTFLFTIKAKDVFGHTIVQKGTVVIIR
jgi:gliding motility-associated-like protein